LNRNFPDQFDANEAKQHIFKGREIETISLMNWILENKFVLSANLHAGAVVASFPYVNEFNSIFYGYLAPGLIA